MVPKDIVLEDIRRLVRAGATHITFGDPDLLNGPRHSLAIVHTMHTEFPALTFDFTAKVEHILERRTFPFRARNARLSVRGLRGRVAQRQGPCESGEGAHPRRRRRGAHESSGPRVPADVGRLHPMDDARRLPRRP